MNKVSRKRQRSIIHVSTQQTPEENIRKNRPQNKSFPSDNILPQKNNIIDQKLIPQHSFNISEQKRSIYGSSKRIVPSEQGQSSVINDSQTSKYSFSDNMKFEKEQKKYCGLQLWSLLLLISSLLALFTVITVVTIVIVNKNKAESLSNSTSTIINTTSTNITTTGSTIINTTSTSVTTTAFHICSNFTVTSNWDYGGNDISSHNSYTFASCCSWCLNVTACVAFTFNQMNSCYIKNSTGTGGGTLINATAAAR